jgi:predicted enzyme related to lactoylglutathione lyase
LDSDVNNRKDPSWSESAMPRIMFPAKNIDEAYAYVRKRATTFSEPHRHGAMAYFNFVDPEGNAQMACWTADASAAPAPAARSPIRPRIGGAFVDAKEMPKLAAWYADLLGLPLDEEQAKRRIYSVPVTRGAALLLDGNRHANGEDYTEICYFETDDFEAALAYVRERGFALAGEPAYFPDLSEFALLDPDGNRIVVAERIDPEAGADA